MTPDEQSAASRRYTSKLLLVPLPSGNYALYSPNGEHRLWIGPASELPWHATRAWAETKTARVKPSLSDLGL